ncbi:MAG: asparagine synthase (glutamine-hydrolyzing) [Planctomycetota bacterium]|nr:asparagine synthase (glutamine-hydrolyzing) [Planctomycetota bacterium]
MCGIAGLVMRIPTGGLGFVLGQMSKRLRHRGPDDDGWLAYGRGHVATGRGAPANYPAEVLLAHRRLAILDLSPRGHQPMSSADGRFHLVFNGEIYNYLELREELRSAGVVFRTETDTEVLLAAFSRWGAQVLTRLIGMFAFAAFDTEARVVTLARDFAGIKPLYYIVDSKRFAFASEIKALLEVPGVKRNIDAQSLSDYLLHGLTDHRAQTMFADVRALPPGHFLTVPLDSSAALSPQCYWRLPTDRAIDCSFDEAAGRLRELFIENVRLHLRSDVPVGTCLSGGIDSSSIVMAVRHLAGPKADVHSFSFVAPGTNVDEESWMDIVASAGATTAHKVQLTPAELVTDLDRLIVTQDEPFRNTSIYAQHRVFRLAQEAGVKVLLDGQGADEMLAGYPCYVPTRFVSLLRGGHLWSAMALLRHSPAQPVASLGQLLRACGRLLTPTIQVVIKGIQARNSSPPVLNEAWFRERGVTNREVYDRRAKRSLRGHLAETLTRSILPMLLRYEDRNSMAFGIEGRVPFLTPKLVEFVFGLPESYLLHVDGRSKRVFRAAMRGLVPDQVLARRDKIGFQTSEHAWLQTLRPWADAVLASDAARAIPMLRLDAVRRECQAVLDGRDCLDWHIWRWVNLIRWSEVMGVSYE